MGHRMLGFDMKQNTFRFTFEDEKTDVVSTMELAFEFDWNHDTEVYEKNILQANLSESMKDSLKGIQIFDNGESIDSEFCREYPATLYKKLLRVYSIAIPNEQTRRIFDEIITSWAKFKSCPLEARALEHVQYPITEVIFNKLVISAKEVDVLVHNILQALANATITERPVEKDEEEELENDDVDFDNIVDYELDEEVEESLQDDEEEDLPFDIGEVVEGDKHD